LTDPDDAVAYWLSRPVEERLARDFKEFLKSLNSNRVEYLLVVGYAAISMCGSTFEVRLIH
jgi:hypothetical protein